MQQLANAIQAHLDTLVDQYDARLQTMPGYVNFPAAARRDLERQMLNLIARCLIAGDSHELVEYSRQRAIQWAGLGLDLAWFQQALVVPEEILVPLIDSVEASTFLWQALNRSQAAVWHMVAERAHTAEQNLRQSQQLLQTVMDNIPQAVFWKDQNLIYLGCNRAFAEDAGIASPAEIVGKTDYDMPWQPQADLYRADDRLVMASGTARLNYEEPQTTPTGEQTWLRTSKVPMHDAHNNITAVLGMYEDITERKRAEESIRDSEERLRAIYEGTNDAVMLLNAQGFFDCNPRTLEMFGFRTREEFTAVHPADVSPQHQPDGQESLPAAQAHIQTAYRQGYDRFEWIHRRTNGEDFPAEVLLSAVDIGKQRVLQATVRDITERKRAEEALARERNLLRTLIDNLPDQIFFKDVAGRIILYNQADARAMGITSTEEALGKTVYDLYPPELADRFHADDMAVIQSGQPLSDREEPGLDEAGQPRWVLTTKVPLTDAQGNRLGLIGVARDITRRKKLEQSIRDSFEQRGRQVEVIRQVSQEIAAAPELSDLFRRVVTLTKERFNYYHTQIFRHDPIKDAIVLVEGYGEAGQKMLEAGHQLPLGRGVVGIAAETGQALLATDVTQDPDWRPNPYLPETKGELAVPIKLRDQVLGILDVQSDRSGALTDDDRLLIEGLCGQIAIAIEYKQAEQALQRNEAELSEALRIAQMGNWSYDVPTDTFTFNDQFYALMHTTAEREGGYTMSSAQYAQRFVHPDDAALVGIEIGKALATPDPDYRGQIDHRIYYADGKPGYITVRFYIEKDAQGNTVKTHGANQDITERKLAEEAVRRSQAELSQALQIAKLAYWEYDVEKDLFLFNDQFYSIFHTTAAQHGGYQLTSAYYAQYFVHPDDLALVGTEIEKALGSTDRHYNRLLEHRILYADGGVGYISVNINIDRDEQGKILRYYGANQDITERKQAEEAVRRSEAELSEALQIAKLGYWEYDVERDLFMFNDQFYTLFHTTAAQHGGYQLPSAYYAEHFVHPEDRGLVGAEIGRSLNSTDRHYNRLLEHRIVYTDGSLGYISVNINIDRDEQGKILRVYGANQDITERKRAEVELKETEERFRIIAETTPVPILISSAADGSVLYGNDQLGQMFGIPIAELIGRPTPDFYFEPADRPALLAQLRQTGFLRDYELHVKRADGTPFWVLVTMRTLMFAGQRALFAAFIDITASRQAAEDLRHSQAQLSEALKIARLAYWEYDVKKDLFQFNDQFYALFHTTAAQHGGYQLSSAYYAEHFVYPDDLPIVGAEIEQALNSTDRHYTRLVEHRIRYADGGVGHISVSINIDRDEHGQILRYYGANQDITDRKLAEAEIRETQERFRIIAETTPIPILITATADGTVLYGNDHAGEAFGLPMEQLLGQTMPDFYVDPADRQVLLAQIRRDGAVHDYELHVKRTDGTPFWVLLSMQPFVFANQSALFAAFIDITPSRRAAEELRRSEAQLSEALKTARLAYWELDLARQKFIFNDQLYALLHTTAEAEGGYEMDVNAYVGRFIYPEDIPYVGATIAQGLQNPDPDASTQLEARVVCADGEVRWLATQVSTKVNEAGQAFKAVGTNQDITERKQAEAEREQLLTEQQKRALQLQTAAEVSRATSSILNLDELLPQSAELVRARFNLYYVGIFLNDEPENWAVLRAGTGDAGQKMLVRGHRLKIGAASMISQCIVKQQAQIALDVGEEAVRFDNPLLPLTRSELALPLISRGRVIGAVSIQSDQSAAFTSDDIIVLQTMADQIGNAIENARLYEQSTAALQEVDALNRRLTGEGWETYLRRGSSQQVIWAGDDETIAPAPLSAVDEQLSAGQIVVEPAPGDEQQTTVSVPVMLRGQAIGALRIAMPEAAYTDELRATLESLAGHVAQAAENARLLDETQARFARERALTEATDKIRRRPEVEHVLQAAAEELARYLQASAINVRLGASVTATGETGQPG